MQPLKWLFPGMLVKRWIFLGVLGIIMISMGFAIIISEDIPASKTGASEMSAAIFSSTLTTVAVFLPMIFVVGVAVQLFKELNIT